MTGATEHRIRAELGYEPREWQQRVHYERHRFQVLALHRRAGKTELAIMELVDAAMKFRLDMGLFIYLAPFFKQARLIAWGRLKERLKPMIALGQVEIREGDTAVKFKHNGCVIRLLGADNADALRGLRIDGGVIDEVAQVKREVWEEILQPAGSDRKAWWMFIGTPNGVNLFSELYFKGQKDPDWHSASWTVYDTQALDPAEVDRLKRDMSDNSFAREYLCDFSAQAENALISLHQVLGSISSHLTEDDVEGSPVIMGVDVARYGDDRSVIFLRKGLLAYQPKIYREVSNMELAGLVAEAIKINKPDLVCIDAGRGEGVIDRLRQLGHSIVEVNFGGKPMDPHYVNKRAEMWDTMRAWLDRGGKLPDVESLKTELCAPLYSYDNAANKFALESKDKIKARGLSSPDLADALALTFAYPVSAKPDIAHTGAQVNRTLAQARGKRGDYDPLDR